MNLLGEKPTTVNKAVLPGKNVNPIQVDNLPRMGTQWEVDSSLKCVLVENGGLQSNQSWDLISSFQERAVCPICKSCTEVICTAHL